jgi:DNA-binding transcriptional LysR family regulator
MPSKAKLRTSARAAPLDWAQVSLFLAVFRERSLARASERLAVDVSTISRRLDRLEEELGGALFDRTRDGTTPTLLAEQMMPHAEEMELAAIRFAAAGAKVETEASGVVRLTAPPGIADAFLAPGLAALHRRHPKLVVELDASVGYADLTRREADLAIRAVRPTSGELVTTKLVTARAAPLASASYARELGKLRALETARWIVWGDDLAHLPDAQWLKKHAPKVEPVFRTSHFASQLAAARAGLGVVITAQPFTTTGLVEVAHARSLDGAWSELPTGTLWLVGHRALRHVPRVAAVWAFVLEALGRGEP